MSYRPPPPGADPTLWNYFIAFDRDGSGTITGEELKQVLYNHTQVPFNDETVRLMLNMFDNDNSGTIQFEEFSRLWKVRLCLFVLDYIDEWRSCFAAFDRDRSGFIDEKELYEALLMFGYRLNPQLVSTLIRKYDRYGTCAKPKNPQGRGDITLDAFIQCCVTIRSLTDSFQRLDADRDGYVNLDYHTFLSLVLANR